MSEHKKSREGSEYSALTDLRFTNTDEALRDVAEILRSGRADQQFLDMLADLLDPDNQRLHKAFGVKLEAKHQKGAGAPKKKNTANIELEDFLEMHIDFFGLKAESVYTVARARFGVSPTTCKAALKDRRGSNDDYPEMLRRFRKSVLELKEKGHPDYQPLW